MIRTFLALDLDERFLDDVASLADRLRGRSRLSTAAKVSWTRRETMHVTVRFFGDTDEALVPQLQHAVRALAAGRGELRVRARRLGAFPDPRRTRVLVLAIEEPRGVLEDVAKRAEALAVGLGFPPDEHGTYKPHLTLARLRGGEDVRELVAATPVDIEGRVLSLTLYRSDLGKGPDGRPLYTAIERAAFG